MNKKGFTLIELLAVIVILAIIALITTPTILGVIERARKGASENSAYGYIDAIEKQVLIASADPNKQEIQDGTYSVEDIELLYKGKGPESGTYVIEKGSVKKAILKFDDYYVCFASNKISSNKDNNKLIECSDIDSTTVYKESILNGAYPEVSGDLVPVTIDNNGIVKKANINTKWYSYNNKIWANAVILKVGATIPEDGIIPEDIIDSYFVWIPRYKYQIFNTGEYSSTISEVPTTSNAKEINVVFESKDKKVTTGTKVGDYLTHPAFTAFDVNGLWVGKYEVTGGTSDIDVKPSQTPLTNQNVLTFFTLGYNYNRELDSHMMKNTEWGAVAYLSHSKYGINKEININNSNPKITGASSLTTLDQTSYPGTYGEGEEYYAAYNTPTGYLASTTGNISGIYDMSGGSWEYMSAYVTGKLGSSGFTEETITNYASKYFDRYDASSSVNSYNLRILGDATGEMGPFYNYKDKDGSNRNHNSWYADHSDFVVSSYPWFVRGGNFNNGVLAGQFHFNRDTGGAVSYSGFRLVLAN